MLTFICSWYQVPPSFLDFIFPFGKKINDSHNETCALRNESRFHARQRGLEIVSLGRSGRDIRICYHLQSVEQSPGQETMEWSIRQTAIYHSYDLVSEKAFWINVKGNQLLEHRVDGEPMLAAPSRSPDGSVFSVTLATHVLFAEWAGQNWRTYIKGLEEMVFSATERTIVIPVDSPSSALTPPPVYQTPQDATLGEKRKPPNDPSSAVSRYTESEDLAKTEVPQMLPRTKTLTSTSFGSEESRFLDDFSFSDVQKIQMVEEMTEKVVGILSRNLTTLRDLRETYASIPRLDLADEEGMREEIETFETQIIMIEKDLETLVERSKTLLKRIHERKTLVSNIY